jgi:hypothetical protein
MCSGLTDHRFPLAAAPGNPAPACFRFSRFVRGAVVPVAAGLLLTAAVTGPAAARPAHGDIPRLELLQSRTPSAPLPAGVFRLSTGQDTVYFGGTFWNAVTMRWEALPGGTWTFDSGVGSSFDHSADGVDPYKDPRLHATMEGWVGIDFTYGGENQYLRLVSDTDPAWEGGTVCVGAGHTVAPGILSGDWSYYCGVFPAESLDLCYADQANPLGYGNNWRVCIGKSFVSTGAAVTLNFNLVWDSEQNYDFTTVEVDTTGAGAAADIVDAIAFDGQGAGAQSFTLLPGFETRSTPGPIQIRFCFTSDGSWSDEDGFNATVCGAFSVDDIAVSGGVTQPVVDFEGGVDGGWVLLPPESGRGGDWSDIAHVDDLPSPMLPCACNLADSVLVFIDLDTGGHSREQDNIAASPWIDLDAQGLTGTPGKFVQFNANVDLPLLNYAVVQELVQWYPRICAATGAPRVSPWTQQFALYFAPAFCTVNGPVLSEWSSIIPPEAEQVRIGLGVVSLCNSYPNCNGVSNTTPWFDDVRFGVYGAQDAPTISAQAVDVPQDAFPANGTLRSDSPGRIDCNTVANATSPEFNTHLGDTLVVHGGLGGAEVHVQFAIAPGPGIDANKLAAFYNKVAFQETRRGLDWYSARMDTAEQGGFGYAGTWMTAFHEEDPGFSGTDTDTDPDDPISQIRGPDIYSHLANDIFPDDLLTPGSRLMLFYRTRYLGGSQWFLYPDTTGGNCLEMEVLPSSMEADGTFNCVLYVDHFDRDGQGIIETALASILPNGSTNWENTAWDRYDVEAAASQQGSFGRPLGGEYGASLVQALGYRVILWNTGNLPAFNLTKEDADILLPWLSLLGFGGNNLYLTGDGIAYSMTQEAATEPSAYDLLTNLCGVTLRCNTFRDQGCPLPVFPEDPTDCLQIDPLSGARTATRPLGGIQMAEGNGCPQQRSFDVIEPNSAASYGTPVAEEVYAGDYKTGRYASVSNDAPLLGGKYFRTVVDGLSIQYRRDPGDCNYTTAAPPQAVEERLREVLGWFGTIGDVSGCMDVTRLTDIPPQVPKFQTALAPMHPNPLTLGTKARVRFSLAEAGPATLAIFDLAGRRVRTLFDGAGKAGWNEAAWDGNDDASRPVASGVYFYRLRTPKQVFADKMVVVRGK